MRDSIQHLIELCIITFGLFLHVEVGVAFAIGFLIGTFISYSYQIVHLQNLDVRFWVGVILAIGFAVIHTWIKELPFLLLMLPPALIGVDPKYFSIWKWKK